MTAEAFPGGSQEPDLNLGPEEQFRPEDWQATISIAAELGPKVAEAFARAADEGMGAHLQPDVLFVDLEVPARSWRHPFPGTVKETTRIAGWTVLERDIPLDGESNARLSESGAEVASDLMDDLLPGMRVVGSERVVLLNNGKLVRLAGRLDASTGGQGPLRFATLKPELSGNERLVLEEYLDANRGQFVDDQTFGVRAILSSECIGEANLNSVDELRPNVVHDALAALSDRIGSR